MKRRGFSVDYDVVKFCAYVTLIIAGGVLLVNAVLGWVDASIPGSVAKILTLIQNIAMLISIGFAAYAFTRGKSTFVKVVYWIALIAYIVFAILIAIL